MLNAASQLVLDHLRTTKDVERWVRNYLAEIPSTTMRIAWLHQYVAERTRTASLLEELAYAMRKQRLRWKHVEWAELVAALSTPSVTEQFLDRILAGDVDVRRAETIQRYEIVPKDTPAGVYPPVHAFVSIDMQDGTVYGDRQTYIESSKGAEILDLDDSFEVPDAARVVDQLEALCHGYEHS